MPQAMMATPPTQFGAEGPADQDKLSVFLFLLLPMQLSSNQSFNR
jgi:hypothetical protein